MRLPRGEASRGERRLALYHPEERYEVGRRHELWGRYEGEDGRRDLTLRGRGARGDGSYISLTEPTDQSPYRLYPLDVEWGPPEGCLTGYVLLMLYATVCHLNAVICHIWFKIDCIAILMLS